MTTTRRHGVQTTIQAMEVTPADGRHVVKYYAGRLSSVWRYPTAADAAQAIVDHDATILRFVESYAKLDRVAPARPWKLVQR